MEEDRAKVAAITLRVAAVQMVSVNRDPEGNRNRATEFVQAAVKQGAKLVVFPELMPNGYVYAPELWDTAEPRGGPTYRWMQETSSRFGIWLGAGILEAERDDFYNTYVITNPDGEVAGSVRKQTPAVGEGFFVKGDKGPHVVRTNLGKIGVGICFENQLSDTLLLLHSHDVDLLLMPHSAPVFKLDLLFSDRAADRFIKNLRGLAESYAKTLGIPVILANKSGPWHSPLPLMPLSYQRSSFPGLSTIADSDHTIKAQLEADQGVIVSDITMDPRRKVQQRPSCSGKWTTEVPLVFKLLRLYESIGAASYRFSGRRKRRAREITSEIRAGK
jgi:N-carbamoylputrescine amidase